MEEQGEADPLAVFLDEDGLGVGPRPEQRLAQSVLGRLDLALELFELRKLPDEAQDVRDIRFRRLDDSRIHRLSSSPRPPVQALCGPR